MRRHCPRRARAARHGLGAPSSVADVIGAGSPMRGVGVVGGALAVTLGGVLADAVPGSEGGPIDGRPTGRRTCTSKPASSAALRSASA